MQVRDLLTFKLPALLVSLAIACSLVFAFAPQQSFAQPTGWQNSSYGWRYFDAAGNAQKGWIQDGDAWYYLDKTGVMVTGWKQVNGAWYFLNPGGDMKTGWHYDNGEWYYLEPSGNMKTGWKYVGDNWYLLGASGAMKKHWVLDKGNWYFLDDTNGDMKTGWLHDKDNWYYLDDANGDMKTGWVQQGEDWYYMDASGAMVTGWAHDGNNWYYLSSIFGGKMQTGWMTIVSDAKRTYYFEPSGAMVTGWMQQGDNWYFFNEDGLLEIGELPHITFPDSDDNQQNENTYVPPENVADPRDYYVTIDEDKTYTVTEEKRAAALEAARSVVIDRDKLYNSCHWVKPELPEIEDIDSVEVGEVVPDLWLHEGKLIYTGIDYYPVLYDGKIIAWIDFYTYSREGLFGGAFSRRSTQSMIDAGYPGGYGFYAFNSNGDISDLEQGCAMAMIDAELCLVTPQGVSFMKCDSCKEPALTEAECFNMIAGKAIWLSAPLER